SGSTCADFDRPRCIRRLVRYSAAWFLAARMRLCTRSRRLLTGSECALVHRRRTRVVIWKAAPAPIDLRALLYTGGAGGICTRPYRKPASLECTRRLSRRPCVPGILPRCRFRLADRALGTNRARNQRILRREI